MGKILIQISLKKTIYTSEGSSVLDINLDISNKSLITLFGRSGAGKTTILRMIAGLTKPESGKIIFDDSVWFESATKTNIKPQFRDLGFVFQDYALFPNMTVREHLNYAQSIKDDNYISELMETFGLNSFESKKPQFLSGGQKQKLSLARALARKPKLLLLDEPLSALDNESRINLQEEILKAHRLFSTATILVSHDLDEISRLSDKVYNLENGTLTEGNV